MKESVPGRGVLEPGSPCLSRRLVLESVDKEEPLKSWEEGSNATQID